MNFKIESVLKEFSSDRMRVVEKVARYPKIEKTNEIHCVMADMFSLRIDADEYNREAFNKYKSLFAKYNNIITIFFCADSFKEAKSEILECKEMGVDIQSHGYYHHAYNDYKSNRYNIQKADSFFKSIGIDAKGFAGPMGKSNFNMIKALEDECYEYSSNFSYDYLGYPSFPYSSNVLEIPIFPVAPELFFQRGVYLFSDILDYYKHAIDEMIDCNIPVIIYAHTSLEYPRVPELLENIAEYAILAKGLRPMNMSEINGCWRTDAKKERNSRPIKCKIPQDSYLGREISVSLPKKAKQLIKEALDFEKITPTAELRCSAIMKSLKILARKII